MKRKLKESEQQRMVDSINFKKAMKEFEKEKDELETRHNRERGRMVDYTRLYQKVRDQMGRRLLEINKSHPELKCLEFEGFKLKATNKDEVELQHDSESQSSPELTDDSDSQDP